MKEAELMQELLLTDFNYKRHERVFVVEHKNLFMRNVIYSASVQYGSCCD